ncbi:MAG: hypothetical protein AB8B96_21660 [Lysobacterales bacterium]
MYADVIEQAGGLIVIVVTLSVLIISLFRTGNKTLDKLHTQLKAASESCIRKRNRIVGTLEGFKYEVNAVGHRQHWGFSVIMKGTFPKQKRFMFDYPVLENKIKWKGNKLVKMIPDKRADEIEATLLQMVILARELQQKGK